MRFAAPALAMLGLLVAAPVHAGERVRLLEQELSLRSGALAAAPVQRSLAWAFVPFGVGQLANDQPVKGGLFFAAEIAAFGVFGVALGAFEGSKTSGSFLGGGTFANTERAKALQTTYLVAFWTGVALAAIGIVDAVIFRPSADARIAVGPGALAARF